MDNEDIITRLILEDLKFNQFLEGLQQYYVTIEYQPELPPLVARLMGRAPQEINDDWVDTYNHYMHMARGCAYHDDKMLLEIAGWCRKALAKLED